MSEWDSTPRNVQETVLPDFMPRLGRALYLRDWLPHLVSCLERFPNAQIDVIENRDGTFQFDVYVNRPETPEETAMRVHQEELEWLKGHPERRKMWLELKQEFGERDVEADK